jgi:hypothetical protein
LLGEVEGRQLEQAVAVIGDDVFHRRLGELAGELAQFLLAGLRFVGLAAGAAAGRLSAGGGASRGRLPGSRPPAAGGARVFGPGDLVLTVRCPEAAHGC